MTIEGGPPRRQGSRSTTGPIVAAAAGIVLVAVTILVTGREGPAGRTASAGSGASSAPSGGPGGSTGPAASADPPASPSASPTASSIADTRASAERPPVGDLPGWRQVVVDDFTTAVPEGSFPAAVAGSWTAYPSGWHDTSGNGTYAPEIVSIHDGLMDIHLRSEAGQHKVAGPIPLLPGSADGTGQLYGRYAVRFRAEPVRGYKTAWLLWPQSEAWPRDGEIDFPEGALDGTIHAYVHRRGAATGADQARFSTRATFAEWHVAVIEWRRDTCVFLLDGRTIGTTTTRVPDTAMRWVLQTETQLTGGPPPDDAQGHVLIDWVAVWAAAA